jgi:hypothetical protein
MVLCIILKVCTSYVVMFLYVERVEITGDCSFCWYWLNRWASLFLLSFHKTIIYITLLRKLKIKQHNTTKQSGMNLVMLRNSKQFLLYYWYLSCTSCLKPVISHKWRKHRIVMTTNVTYLWKFVTHIFVLVNRKTLSISIIVSVASLTMKQRWTNSSELSFSFELGIVA